MVHFSNIPRQLRSSTSQQLSIPRTKLNLGKRAFSVAAPIIWNELPTKLKSCESLASFRKNLKSIPNCFFTLNSRRPLILMMTPILLLCPRFLAFVLLRFRARAPEDLSAIEVIYLLLLIIILLFCLYTLLKVVGYYDLSVMSMQNCVHVSDGFQKKFGWGVGGWVGWALDLSKLFLDFWNFFNFAKPLSRRTFRIHCKRMKCQI